MEVINKNSIQSFLDQMDTDWVHAINSVLIQINLQDQSLVIS